VPIKESKQQKPHGPTLLTFLQSHNGIFLTKVLGKIIRRQGLLQVPNEAQAGQGTQHHVVGDVKAGTMGALRPSVMVLVIGFSYQGFKHPGSVLGQPLEFEGSNALVSSRLVDANALFSVALLACVGVILDVEVRSGERAEQTWDIRQKESPLHAHQRHQTVGNNHLRHPKEEVEKQDLGSIVSRRHKSPVRLRLRIRPPQPGIQKGRLRPRVRIFRLVAMLVMTTMLGGPPQDTTLQRHGSQNTQKELHQPRGPKGRMTKVPVQRQGHGEAHKGHTGHDKDGYEGHERCNGNVAHAVTVGNGEKG